MGNLDLYNKVRVAPADALKPIAAGRLKGKSDINPMWRIKTLTEQFGICGIGWYYEITNQWLEQGNGGEIAAFCNINLYIRQGGEWSKPIVGTGGSAFVASEKNGLYTSDECFKMALTDAISVACKAIGMAADVYWQSDRTKYDQPHEPVQKPYEPVEKDKYDKYVAGEAQGLKTPNGRPYRTAWAGLTHAGDKELAQFDADVRNYKINNNLQ